MAGRGKARKFLMVKRYVDHTQIVLWKHDTLALILLGLFRNREATGKQEASRREARRCFDTACEVVDDFVLSSSAAAEMVIEAVATEGVHAARGVRELVGLAVQCGLTLALVYVTLWIWIRLRRPTRGELAVQGVGPESSNAIAGDGPGAMPEPSPRGRSAVPRAILGRSVSQPALGSRASPPRDGGGGEALALRAATRGLQRAAADVAVGSRGALGMRLAVAGRVGPWRRGSEGVYEFDVPGTGRMVYTVRMPLARPGDASCSCADHVRDGFTCKHIIAALLTASRLDARAVPAPARPPPAGRARDGEACSPSGVPNTRGSANFSARTASVTNFRRIHGDGVDVDTWTRG